MFLTAEDISRNLNDKETISNLLVIQKYKPLQRSSELIATIHRVTRKCINLTLTFKNKPYLLREKKNHFFTQAISEKDTIMQKLTKEHKYSLST